MPTLRQLQARHPDAVMKWFARGRLWETEEAERADALARRTRRAPAGDRRGRDWRPGGEHQDPRDRFKVPRDEKRRRFAANLRRDRDDVPRGTDRPINRGTDRPINRGTDRPLNRGTDRPLNNDARDRAPGSNRTPKSDRFARPDRPPRVDRAGKPPWKREGESTRERGGARRDSAGARKFGTPRPPRGRKPGGGKPGGGRGGGGAR
jgi:23S rRNA pseudouridine2605 synthase